MKSVNRGMNFQKKILIEKVNFWLNEKMMSKTLNFYETRVIFRPSFCHREGYSFDSWRNNPTLILFETLPPHTPVIKHEIKWRIFSIFYFKLFSNIFLMFGRKVQNIISRMHMPYCLSTGKLDITIRISIQG